MKKTIFVLAALVVGLLIVGCTQDNSADTQVVPGDAAAKAAASAKSTAPADNKIPDNLKDKIPNAAPGMNTGK